MTLTVIFDCRILAHGSNVMRKMSWVSSQMHADGVDPWEYECRRCHQTWNDAVLTDPREVTCSNCYSDNVIISALRLGFDNWGEHNGGEAEQRARFNRAANSSAAREAKRKGKA